MKRKQIIIYTVLVLSCLLLIVTTLKENTLTFVIRAIGFPLLAFAYYIGVSSKKTYFFYFMLTFAICEFLGIFVFAAYKSKLVNDMMFYGRNTLYILSYVFLLIEMLGTFNLKRTFKRFLFPTLLLVSIGSYMAYVASEITLNSESFTTENIFDSITTIAYNMIVSMLFITAALKYLNNDTKKNMTMLVGIICIVFSETIQLASFYISSELILSIMHTTLIILAFYFLFIQSEMELKEGGSTPLKTQAI